MRPRSEEKHESGEGGWIGAMPSYSVFPRSVSQAHLYALGMEVLPEWIAFGLFVPDRLRKTTKVRQIGGGQRKGGPMDYWTIVSRKWFRWN